MAIMRTIDRETSAPKSAPAGDAAIWYFDVVSPFAYLALPAVELIACRRPVLFRPIVFSALLAHWGQLGPAEIAPKRTQYLSAVPIQGRPRRAAAALPGPAPVPLA